MTITNGYTTLAAMKVYEAIGSTDATDDGVIEALVEAASRYIDGVTLRRFHSTTADETRTYQSSNGKRVHTDDIISVTTLKTDEDGDRTHEITWATTDYDLLPENAALNGGPYTYIEVSPNGRYTFPTQRKGVQIIGKFGYSTTAPDAVELACQMIVVNVYKNRFGTNTSGAATVTGAGVVITPADIPAGVEKLLAQYKRFS